MVESISPVHSDVLASFIDKKTAFDTRISSPNFTDNRINSEFSYWKTVVIRKMIFCYLSFNVIINNLCNKSLA